MVLLRRRTIIAMAGLPGTGKSTLAAELGRRLHAIVLSKDGVRAKLFPSSEIRFTRGQDDFCMNVLFFAADCLFKSKHNQAVIIDGRTFSKSYQVEQLLSHAKAIGAIPVMIECVCDDAVAGQRIEHDMKAGTHPAANRNHQLYMDLKAQAEPISLEHPVIDTGRQPLEKCVKQSVEYIKARVLAAD